MSTKEIVECEKVFFFHDVSMVIKLKAPKCICKELEKSDDLYIITAKSIAPLSESNGMAIYLGDKDFINAIRVLSSYWKLIVLDLMKKQSKVDDS